jgi:hypothetical protein
LSRSRSRACGSAAGGEQADKIIAPERAVQNRRTLADGGAAPGGASGSRWSGWSGGSSRRHWCRLSSGRALGTGGWRRSASARSGSKLVSAAARDRRPYLSRHFLAEQERCLAPLPFLPGGAADAAGVSVQHNLLALSAWAEDAQEHRLSVVAQEHRLSDLAATPPTARCGRAARCRRRRVGGGEVRRGTK